MAWDLETDPEFEIELDGIRAFIATEIVPVQARTLLEEHRPVEGRPTEHIPSRRPAAEAKWAELRAEAGVA